MISLENVDDCLITISQIVANATDPLSPIYDTFAKDGAKRDWADCCAAAKSCCSQQIEAKQLQSEREYQIIAEGKPTNIYTIYKY